MKKFWTKGNENSFSKGLKYSIKAAIIAIPNEMSPIVIAIKR